MIEVRRGKGAGLRILTLSDSGARINLAQCVAVQAVLILPDASTKQCTSIAVDDVRNYVYVKLSSDDLATNGKYSITLSILTQDNVRIITSPIEVVMVSDTAEEVLVDEVYSFKAYGLQNPERLQKSDSTAEGAKGAWLVYDDILDMFKGFSKENNAPIEHTHAEFKNFLRKDKPDTANELITFLKGLITDELKSTDYTAGAFGSGMRMWMQDGQSHAEIDNLHVRMEAIFNKLTIAEVQSVGGQQVLSVADMQCNKVEDRGDYYRCYFDTKDGTIPNRWVINDQARCQNWNGNQKFYWRLVVSVGANYIDLSKIDCNGSGVPEARDAIVQLGNRTDLARQNAIVLSAYGVDAPSFNQYEGIHSYSLVGCEVTVISPKGNKITGDLRIKSGNKIIPIPADRGAYIAGETYRYYDRVSHNGALWLCVIAEGKTTTSAPPSEAWLKQVDKGVDGLPGEPGADGKTAYTHIAYADDVQGNGFSQQPTNKACMGVYVDNIELDSTDKTKYKWSVIKGAQGEKGDKGVAGAAGSDGRTPYFHIAYADNAQGGGFSQMADGKEYIGTYTDYTEGDSSDVSRYTWVKVKGADGKDAGVNLLKWQEEWTLGSDDLLNWKRNGTVAENERIMGENPFRVQSKMWKCKEQGNGEASGGFDTFPFITLDASCAYRYCVFVFKFKNSGILLHGANGVSNMNGTANNNPYFINTASLPVNKWFLMVGLVNTAGTMNESGISGVYDMSGKRIIGGTDYKQSNPPQTVNFRSYNYYDGDSAQEQYFYNPMLHKLDGTEPSIEQILQISTRKEIDAVKATSEAYAAAQAELARVKAEANADGKITAAEARAIADATNKANAARDAAIAAASVDTSAKIEAVKTTYDKKFESTDKQFLSVLSETKTYADNTTRRTSKLIDARSLDPNKYYPITIGLPPTPCKITVSRELNSGYGVPSYSTHPNGVAVSCQWTSNGHGWGVIGVNRIIHQFASAWSNGDVTGSIGQMGHSSQEYIYVRGGSMYDVLVEGLTGCDINLRTQTYTMYDETILLRSNVDRPIPTLDSSIASSEDRLKGYVKEQNYSTIKQTAESINLSINNIKVGGNNLLIKSKDFDKWSFDSSGANAIGTATKQADGSVLVVNNNSNSRFNTYASGLSGNTDYTVSIKYKKKTGTPTFRFQIGGYIDNASIGAIWSTGTVGDVKDVDGWQTVYCTFNFKNAGVNRVQIYFQSGADYVIYNNSFFLKEPMLEKSNIVSDYSLSQEELPTKDDIIASINLSKEEALINAERIRLKGKTVADAIQTDGLNVGDKTSIDKYGNFKTVNATISGSISMPFKRVTYQLGTSYVPDLSDIYNLVVYATPSANAADNWIVIRLPDASLYNGRVFNIFNNTTYIEGRTPINLTVIANPPNYPYNKIRVIGYGELVTFTSVGDGWFFHNQYREVIN